MNILYCTIISNNKSTGLYWSVPNQIKAQSKYDNVFWYNLSTQSDEYWTSTNLYNSLNDFPSGKIKDLPCPFNKPDLVVFESFYVPFYSLFFQICKLRIPYVIVPRGALTNNAQKKKLYKKIIGNLVFWKKFANKALAIHYLTEDERSSSAVKWNKKSFVVPNGVITFSCRQWKPKITQENRNTLIGAFIGRISIFHKGLDLLVEACSIMKKEMEKANVKINIYGPNFENEKAALCRQIDNNKLAEILIVQDKIFDKEKEEVLLNSDFFVLTSRLEGHPMALIEALSYGLPCLVTKGTNMKSVIEEGNAGWGADNTVESIVDAFSRMISERKTFSDKSVNAITIAQKYKWSEVANETHYNYSKLLGKT